MRALLLFVVILNVNGCAVHNLHQDQDQIRQALLDLYTDQIMDNLIRASNGLPIIQLDYTNATGTVTCKQSAAFGENQNVTNSTVLTAAVATTRTIVTGITGSISADRTNQVAVTATPVVTSNEVYDAYLEFLSLPGSLLSDCSPPPPCSVQICRQWNGMYYWVPLEYREAFLKLSLATTAQRGKALFVSDEFFTVSLKEVLDDEPGQFDDVLLLTIQLDKKIPRDSGFVKVNIGGIELQYIIRPPDEDAMTSLTDKIILTFDQKENGPKDLPSFKGKLPLPAKVYLRYHQPKPPTTDVLLERMNFQLQQIHFDQLRGVTPGI